MIELEYYEISQEKILASECEMSLHSTKTQREK